jgi:hypothetical protein
MPGMPIKAPHPIAVHRGVSTLTIPASGRKCKHLLPLPSADGRTRRTRPRVATCSVTALQGRRVGQMDVVLASLHHESAFTPSALPYKAEAQVQGVPTSLTSSFA